MKLRLYCVSSSVAHARPRWHPLRRCFPLIPPPKKKNTSCPKTTTPDLGIEPQFYALRWIRLLCGREFHIEDVIVLWDGLFADSAALTLVDHVCLAMLIFLRPNLVGND